MHEIGILILGLYITCWTTIKIFKKTFNATLADFQSCPTTTWTMATTTMTATNNVVVLLCIFQASTWSFLLMFFPSKNLRWDETTTATLVVSTKDESDFAPILRLLSGLWRHETLSFSFSLSRATKSLAAEKVIKKFLHDELTFEWANMRKCLKNHIMVFEQNSGVISRLNTKLELHELKK